MTKNQRRQRNLKPYYGSQRATCRNDNRGQRSLPWMKVEPCNERRGMQVTALSEVGWAGRVTVWDGMEKVQWEDRQDYTHGRQGELTAGAF